MISAVAVEILSIAVYPWLDAEMISLRSRVGAAESKPIRRAEAELSSEVATLLGRKSLVSISAVPQVDNLVESVISADEGVVSDKDSSGYTVPWRVLAGDVSSVVASSVPRIRDCPTKEAEGAPLWRNSCEETGDVATDDPEKDVSWMLRENELGSSLVVPRAEESAAVVLDRRRSSDGDNDCGDESPR